VVVCLICAGELAIGDRCDLSRVDVGVAALLLPIIALPQSLSPHAMAAC
jgi:hypothetical protein